MILRLYRRERPTWGGRPCLAGRARPVSRLVIGARASFRYGGKDWRGAASLKAGMPHVARGEGCVEGPEKGSSTERRAEIVRLRKRYLPLVAVLGAAVAVLPALAASATAKLEVNENCVQPDWPCWATPGSSQPAFKTTVAAGGTVTFVDQKTAANIAWTGTAPTCEASVPVAPAAPKTGWEGKCTFETPGTYKFESSTLFKDAYEDYTKYEVVAEGSTTTTTTPGTTGTTTTTTTTSPPSPESLLAGSESQAVKVAKSQHGGSVKGSIDLSKAAADYRLEVDLLTQSASLTKAKHSTRVRVGRYVRSPLSAGKLSFSVKLNAQARRAIKRHHRLALTVEIVLTPAGGEGLTIARSVTLHA